MYMSPDVDDYIYLRTKKYNTSMQYSTVYHVLYSARCPPTQLPPVIVEPAELEPSQEPAVAEDEVDVTSRDTDIWRRLMPVVDLRRLSS